MELNVAGWKVSTSKIFNGVLLFSLSGIVGGVISAILTLAGAPGIALWVAALAGVASILGYVFYIQGLNGLQAILQGEDASAISKVKTAAILLIIGAIVTVVLSVIPILGTVVGGIISGVLNLIGCILSVIAFSSLKKSATFPAAAMGGVSKLFTAYVLNLISYGLILTVILAVVAPILSLVAFIMIIIGWSNIKNAEV